MTCIKKTIFVSQNDFGRDIFVLFTYGTMHAFFSAKNILGYLKDIKMYSSKGKKYS
jgi:hypothetical protein